MAKLALKEIAARISAHLQRIEKNPRTNPVRNRMHKFYQSWAYQGSKYVRVVYVSYQGASSLTREEAEAYLAWLDARHVGTHYDYQRKRGDADAAAQAVATDVQ